MKPQPQPNFSETPCSDIAVALPLETLHLADKDETVIDEIGNLQLKETVKVEVEMNVKGKLVRCSPLPIKKINYWYKMNYKNRGKALIFNHESFSDDKHPKRKGSNVDVEALTKTFNDLGFTVEVYDDLPRRRFLQTLEKFAAEDHNDNDCMIISILTHGNMEEIHAFDEPIKREQIWEPFTATNCPTLAGKPKIFFIQACRGTKLDRGAVWQGTEEELDTSPLSEDQEVFKISNHCDFITYQSCYPGYSSLRHGKYGSCFIQTLCRFLDEHATDVDLLSLTTAINCEMAVNFKTCSRNPELNDLKQCPVVKSSLTRNIIFRPKPKLRVEVGIAASMNSNNNETINPANSGL